MASALWKPSKYAMKKKVWPQETKVLTLDLFWYYGMVLGVLLKNKTQQFSMKLTVSEGVEQTLPKEHVA
jgi:hypothetical protein